VISIILNLGNSEVIVESICWLSFVICLLNDLFQLLLQPILGFEVNGLVLRSHLFSTERLLRSQSKNEFFVFTSIELKGNATSSLS